MQDRLQKDDIHRYSRHLLLPEVGRQGQEALARARVLLIGVGGLGSPAALYLAAAGIGTLGLVDDDVVDVSNLQRQVLYSEDDVGQAKVDAAAKRLRAMNHKLQVLTYPWRLQAARARELFADYDVIVDGSDNFATRYLVNDFAVLLGKANAHGSIYRFDGQASFFAGDKQSPCYRCLFPSPPPAEAAPSCAEGGVLGVLPGTIGLVQATETLKHILGIGSRLNGRLLMYNALGMEMQVLRFARSPECPLCQDPAAFVAKSYGEMASNPEASQQPACELGQSVPEISVELLHAWQGEGRPHTLIDVRSAQELAICRIPDSVHIPMSEAPSQIPHLPSCGPIVLYCKSGGRSARVAQALIAQGMRDVYSLQGGVLAWVRRYDPAQATY